MATKAQVEELELEIRTLEDQLTKQYADKALLEQENQQLKQYNETLNKQLKRVKNAFVVASDALEDL